MPKFTSYNKDIQVLVTTMGKDFSEMIQLFRDMNIQEDCVIRSQCGMSCEKIEKINGRTVRMVMANDKGLSKNRNELLNLSSKKYIIFADDDEFFGNGFDLKVTELPGFQLNAIGFAFPVIRRGKVFYRYNRVKRIMKPNYGFGIQSFIFNRQRLIEHRLTFNELFGSGSIYNHGEDSIFLQSVFSKGKIYSIGLSKPIVSFINNRSSTWFAGVTDDFIRSRSVLIGYLHPYLMTAYLIKMFIQYKLYLKGYHYFDTLKNAREGKKLRDDCLTSEIDR